jgi:hypothetical protein
VNNRHDTGVKRVQTYLERGWIVFNPSGQSGCRTAWKQMVNYRSHEEGVYSGPRGVVKRDDEAVDCLRYIVMANPYFVHRGCGVRTGAVVEPTANIPAEKPEETPEERNLRLQFEASAAVVGSLQPHGFSW